MLKLLRKKQLTKKIILSLCLGMSCAASAYAAETNIGDATVSKTATTSLASGYQIDGTSTTISATSITAVADNSQWSTSGAASAAASGVVSNGHTGIILQNQTGSYLPITAIAIGGSAASEDVSAYTSAFATAVAPATAYGIRSVATSSITISSDTTISVMATGGSATTGNVSVYAAPGSATAVAVAYANASAGATGIDNYNASTTISGNTTIAVIAAGGNATAKDVSAYASGVASASADAYAYADARGMANYTTTSTTTIKGDATIAVTATGGSATATNASTSTSATAYAQAYGICGSTTINGNTTIKATAIGGTATGASADANAYAYGISAYDSSTVNLYGDTFITTTAKAGTENGTAANAYTYALYANGSGTTININRSGSHIVRLTGDVAAASSSAINLTLNNSSSYLRGNVLTDSTGTVNLTLANGAVWRPVYDNSNGTQNSDNSVYTNYSLYTSTSDYISALTLDGGIIDLTWDNPTRTSSYRTLTIGSVSGSGTIKINTDLTNNTGDSFAISSATGTTSLGVAITYDPVMDSLNGLGYHSVGNGYSPLTSGSETLTGATSERKEYSYVPVFNGSTITGLTLGISSNTKAAASSASSQAELMQISVNHLRKRLGDFRTVPDTPEGVWARLYTGDLSSTKYSEVESDYKGIQLGYDIGKQMSDGKIYTGGALSYTTADNSFSRGGGTSKSSDIALYKTWIGKDGHYYDIIAKQGRLTSDYNVTDLSGNYSTANYKTWTSSLSAEYGYRKQLKNGWYLEPQAELTYAHINGVDYTTSSGMSVRQSGINSLTGRLGLGIGKQLKSGNHLYSSLSVLHEFNGKENILADTLAYSQDMSGTWYEFILGMTAKLGNHSNGYFNVEKLFGGSVHSNWQINAGCRWSF